MGYVEPAFAKPLLKLDAIVRGKPLPVQIAPLPFVKTNYYRG
jgi:aminomethyltransferase